MARLHDDLKAGKRPWYPMQGAAARQPRRPSQPTPSTQETAKQEAKAMAMPDVLAGRLAVSLPEAAYLLGISRRHARDLVNEGMIKVIYLGSKRVVTAVELRRLLGLDEENA